MKLLILELDISDVLVPGRDVSRLEEIGTACVQINDLQ